MINVSGLGPFLGHRMEWMTARELFREATGEDPLEWQVDYLADERDAVVLKGRQVGASTSAGVIAVRRAMYWDNSFCAIVSPSQKQSTEVKERAKQHALNLGLRLTKDSSTTVGLANGSRIVSLPGTAKSVRGWSAHLLVIDEAAFLDEETFLAARATVAATGGRTIVQSTPRGPFGPFYDLWADTDPRWAKFRVSSEDVPTISKEFLANEKATMTPEEYAQEYLGEFTTPGLGLITPERLGQLTEKAAEKESPWAKLRAGR